MRIALLLTVLALGGPLAACGGDDSAASGAADLAVPWVDPNGDLPYIGSLSVNPADGSLLMGTNTGLFEIPREGGKPAKLIGELSTPGGTGKISESVVARFTGPDELVGSGHPPKGSMLPPALGIIRSSDAGRTWNAVSGLGSSDYHVLALSAELLIAPVYGQSQISLSRDGGRRFESRAAPMPLVDLAADPADPRRWASTSEQGIFVSVDEGRTWRQRDPTPNVRLAWAESRELYRIDPGGQVKVSADGGETWEDRGTTGGEPHALTVDAEGTLFSAAFDGTVQRSDDGGRTWRVIVEGG
jgi:photosystem II stability/assembly factor-like uncharacterized protein